MLMNPTSNELESDFAILETIGEQVDQMIDKLMSAGVIHKTLRRWLVGHADVPDDGETQNCLSAMAADLEMFTPSTSGRTMVDRHVRARTPATAGERQAFQALSAAQFRLIRIVDRDGPGLVRLQDLVTGEQLLLLDERISPTAAGLPTAMRLCPLESGRHVLISPLFALDEAMLDSAMTFVRQGRPLGHGHRCAASVYRTVARRGFYPVPQEIPELDEDELLEFLQEIEEQLTPVERLALSWITRDESEADLRSSARRLTSVDNLVDALGSFAGGGSAQAPDGLLEAYEEIAALQVETIVGRARAGVNGAAEMLDLVASEIDGLVAQARMGRGAQELFDRLRLRWSFAGTKTDRAEGTASSSAEIDRVIQRIQALRAKTADRGCTEAEAMAAAAKVSQLLARHDLTLDEVSVRRSDCEGVSVATGRKRRAPVDSCMPSIAEFCDCRVWSEEHADGRFGYLFFGLKTDVEAARFLHDLIETTFDTESTTFKQGAMYLSLRGGDRRTALNSFQIGLAAGIVGKLSALKAARQNNGTQSTGYDLVAVKHSLLDDEIDRLGLHFTTRTTTSRRYVDDDAYRAGKVAGATFEPAAALES